MFEPAHCELTHLQLEISLAELKISSSRHPVPGLVGSPIPLAKDIPLDAQAVGQI